MIRLVEEREQNMNRLLRMNIKNGGTDYRHNGARSLDEIKIPRKINTAWKLSNPVEV